MALLLWARLQEDRGTHLSQMGDPGLRNRMIVGVLLGDFSIKYNGITQSESYSLFHSLLMFLIIGEKKSPLVAGTLANPFCIRRGKRQTPTIPLETVSSWNLVMMPVSLYLFYLLLSLYGK